jgi:hypothetical protein
MAEASLLRSVGTSSAGHVLDIETLTDIAGSEVVLSSFVFSKTDSTTMVTLIGTARTRAALANFRDAIEADERFADAILPISSLIKDRNIDFTMTVTSTHL